MTKLLVIEDEAPLLSVILTMLRHSGFDVVGALDGAAGIGLAHTYRPDLIISDIRMPEMDGYDVLQALRSDPETATVPFIFLTARVEHRDMRAGMELGADDYVTKPFTKDELLAAIETRLTRQTYYTDLEQRLTQVSKVEKLKTDMLRMAAHDLRNPITAVRVALSLLKHKHQAGLLTHSQDEFDQIAIAATQMETITSDILSLERVEATARGATLQVVNLVDLVESSYLAYRPQAQVKRLAFDLEITTPMISVLADAAQLREAIHNLLTNAIKYTPEDGEIIVRLDRMGKMCRLTVEDTGYGIPKNQLDQLFQPFYRVQTPETSVIEGSGLGLHLVKNIIERHRGEMLVQSVYGEGSVFGFFLPAHTDTVSSTVSSDDEFRLAEEPIQISRPGLVRRLIGHVTSL